MDRDEINKQGGPAFPVSIPGSGDNGWQGMTLRDYFAAQAVIGLPGDAKDYEILAWFGRNAAGITSSEIRAARAYDIADAMLARRNSKR